MTDAPQPPKQDAPTIGKEISNNSINDRLTASYAILGMKKEDFAKVRAQIEQNIDMDKLGLKGFHLDADSPVVKGGVLKADKAADHKDHDIPALLFTNDKGEQRVLQPNGEEYAVKNSAMDGAPVRAADIPQPPATGLPAPDKPGDPPAKPGDPPAKPGDPPAKPGDPPAKPGDPPPAGDQPLSDADKASLTKFLQQKIEDASKSVPVKRGEGYYQVLRRMHPEMSPEDAVKEARRIKEINGKNNVLKVGEQLPLMSDDDKAAALTQQLANFDKASPADKAAFLAQAKAAFPGDPPADPPKPGDPPKTGDPPADPPKPGDPPKTGDPPADPPKPGDPPKTGDPPADPPKTGDPPADPPKTGDPPADPPKTGDPPADPPATTDGAVAPGIDVTSANFNPIDPGKDKTDQSKRIFSPIAPIGLTEGGADQELKTVTAGVVERKVTTNQDGSKTITGSLDDTGSGLPIFGRNHLSKPDGSGLDWNLGDTTFKTNETFKDGKLDTRDTEYSRGISMNFTTADAAKPVHIDGVKSVVTHFDASVAGYVTEVTDENKKVYRFTSDTDGKINGYTPPQS